MPRQRLKVATTTSPIEPPMETAVAIAAAPKRRRTTTKRASVSEPVQLDAMFSGVISAAKGEFGNNAMVGSPDDVVQVGLPLPSLAPRYMFQANIFPLGRIWQLAGQEGSCKTALLFELLRWHMIYKGGGAIIENENKESEILRHGILEYNRNWITERLAVIRTGSTNEWQAALTQQIDAYKRAMDAKGGPGRIVPIFLGIDSLTATDTQANIDKVAADGFASRGYAEQANVISRYMRSLVSPMRNYPFSVIGTNHMKPATDYLGRPSHNIPGGKAVPFMATFMVESTRVCDIDTATVSGIRLGLKMAKNSMGPSRRWIEVDFLWWWQIDPRTNTPRQYFHWDWGTAAVEMLLVFDSERIKGKKTLFKAIKDIIGLEVIRSQKLAWSKVLGIPESDPVHYRNFSTILEQRPDLLRQLYPLLGIGVYPMFQAGVDFRTSYNLQQPLEQQSAASLYADTLALPHVDVDAIDPRHAAAAEEPETEAEAA